jgi:hypothetical protein
MCKAKAAEFRKRAAEIADPDIKNMYLELAARWLEVSAAYEAIAKPGRSDPSFTIRFLCGGLKLPKMQSVGD